MKQAVIDPVEPVKGGYAFFALLEGIHKEEEPRA